MTTEEKTMSDDMKADEMTVEQWLAIRKEAGRHIDPATAEVEWWHALTLDPYGVDPPPEEYQQGSRVGIGVCELRCAGM
jgi:hypothetical protein